jgi:hypothetical protein
MANVFQRGTYPGTRGPGRLDGPSLNAAQKTGEAGPPSHRHANIHSAVLFVAVHP